MSDFGTMTRVMEILNDIVSRTDTFNDTERACICSTEGRARNGNTFIFNGFHH